MEIFLNLVRNFSAIRILGFKIMQNYDAKVVIIIQGTFLATTPQDI